MGTTKRSQEVILVLFLKGKVFVWMRLLSKFPAVGWHCLKSDTTSFVGLKCFVCVVVCSACQDIHEQQSQAGELIKYIYVCV